MKDVFILTRNGSQFEGVFNDYDSTVKHMRLLFKRLSNIERSISQVGSFVIQRTKPGMPVGHGYFEHWSRKRAGALGCRSKGDSRYSYHVPQKFKTSKDDTFDTVMDSKDDYSNLLDKLAKPLGGQWSGGGMGLGTQADYDHSVEVPYHKAEKFEKLLKDHGIKFKREGLYGGYEF